MAYEDKYGYSVDYEPEEPEGEDTGPRPVRVVIVTGMHDTWVSFKDATDVELGFNGRTYRNPSQDSMKRLARAANKRYMSLEFDYLTPIVTIHRQEL